MLVEEKQLRQLDAWYKLRQRIEYSEDPFLDVVNFFSKLPQVKIYTDPYDDATWPTPWELITENEYCNFNKTLGICYTLQLTERFKDCHPKINVAIDKFNKTVYYLLFIKDKVYGYDEDNWISANQLPKSLITQKMYDMKVLH